MCGCNNRCWCQNVSQKPPPHKPKIQIPNPNHSISHFHLQKYYAFWLISLNPHWPFPFLNTNFVVRERHNKVWCESNTTPMTQKRWHNFIYGPQTSPNALCPLHNIIINLSFLKSFFLSNSLASSKTTSTCYRLSYIQVDFYELT